MECGFKSCRCGVAGEAFDDTTGGGLGEVGLDGGEAFGAACEDGDSEVTVGGVGENSCYPCALRVLVVKNEEMMGSLQCWGRRP